MYIYEVHYGNGPFFFKDEKNSSYYGLFSGQGGIKLCHAGLEVNLCSYFPPFTNFSMCREIFRFIAHLPENGQNPPFWMTWACARQLQQPIPP